ncbi:hypothetical protein STEG23_012884, partial [Scotinomys teguina]
MEPSVFTKSLVSERANTQGRNYKPHLVAQAWKYFGGLGQEDGIDPLVYVWLAKIFSPRSVGCLSILLL